MPSQTRPVAVPTHDDRGQQLGGQPLQRAPNVTVVNQTINNTTIYNNIQQRVNMGGLDRDRYYWFDQNGTRWCHHYDQAGVNWFGFYLGSAYFWTRYYNDRLWWEDEQYHRWMYFHDGSWWWQNPDDVRVIYLYRGGGYYRYDRVNNGVVLQPDPTPPTAPAPDPTPGQPEPMPAPAPASDAWYYSDDATRSVQVTGDQKTAFLYDATQRDADGNAQFLNYLSRNVVNVQFSDTAPDENGAAEPLQIVLTVRKPEGKPHVVAFDAQGVRLGSRPAPAPAEEPGADSSTPPTTDLDSGLQQSAAFNTLQGGVNW